MNTPRLATVFASFAALASVNAQQPTTAPAASSGGGGEVVQLSAFEVTSAKDKGYSARDTVGASRIAIPNAELSQSIAIINEEMMRDLAANRNVISLEPPRMYTLRVSREF